MWKEIVKIFSPPDREMDCPYQEKMFVPVFLRFSLASSKIMFIDLNYCYDESQEDVLVSVEYLLKPNTSIFLLLFLLALVCHYFCVINKYILLLLSFFPYR